MKNKPYLSCPICGEKQMSLAFRASCYKSSFSHFRCSKCNARFRIPWWCGLLQVMSLIPLAAFGYYLSKWMGIYTDGLRLILIIFLMLLGLDGLGILFAYKVPFEVMGEKE